MRTHLGRPIDPSYASNLYAVAVSAAMGAVLGGGALLTGSDDWFALAFRAGMATFLAWAIGREVDPDDVWAAGIAAPLAGVGVLLGPPDLASTVGVLIALRIVIRPTGHHPTTIDEAGIVVLGAFLGLRIGTWPALLGLAIAAAWDGLLPRPAPRRTFASALLAIGAGMVTAYALGEPDWEWIAPTGGEWAVLAVAVIVAVLALPTAEPRSIADISREPLDRRRLHAGKILGLGMGLAAVAWLGGPGITGSIPLWAAFAGVVLARARRSVTGVDPGSEQG